MQGGKRRKLKHRDGQKLLLDAIWRKLGGPAAVAKKLGVHAQAPINWRNRGGVPLVDCMRVASLLGIPEYGLNYSELYKFYRTEIVSWEEAVKQYQLDKLTENKILSFRTP